MTRKFECIRQDLTTLTEQGTVKGFLKNVRNADKLGGLLEDIRDAMMEYQVWVLFNYLVLQHLMFEPGFIATGYVRQELSDHRGSHSFAPFLRQVNCVQESADHALLDRMHHVAGAGYLLVFCSGFGEDSNLVPVNREEDGNINPLLLHRQPNRSFRQLGRSNNLDSFFEEVASLGLGLDGPVVTPPRFIRLNKRTPHGLSSHSAWAVVQHYPKQDYRHHLSNGGLSAAWVN